MKINFRQLIRPLGVNLFQLAPIGALDYLAPETALCVCYHMVSNNPLAHLKHYELLTAVQFEQDLNDLEHHFPYI